MSVRIKPIAKLLKPRLFDAVARERLFEQLDLMRRHSVVWLNAPPGAGKSTLLGGYVDRVRLPFLWYQIDAGDGDLSTFFYYLREAVAREAPSGSRLPSLFTPEYADDLTGFTRRFMRSAMAALPADIQWVLDNYHEAPADCHLHSAMSILVSELPEGSNIFVASRAPPPPELAVLQVNRGLVRLGWEELRLTETESRRIAAQWGMTDPHISAKLHRLSDGWVAGMVLLLEQARKGGVPWMQARPDTLETLFDYFSQVVFDDLPQRTQEVLMQVALLPRIDARMAEQLTARQDAIDAVEALFRRHLFVDRGGVEPPLYQFHAMFRAYLAHQARTRLGVEKVRENAIRAGGLLMTRGQYEAAFALLLIHEAWSEAEQAFVRAAPDLIAQGRWRVLREWAEALPRAQVDSSAWLQFWQGRSLTFADPGAACPLIERAYALFDQESCAPGMMLCAAAMLEALYFQYREFRRMDAWIERLANFLERGLLNAAPRDALWVESMFVAGATFRNPDHPRLPSSVRSIGTLLEHDLPANLRISAATTLMTFAYSVIDPEAERIAIRVAHPLLGDPDLTGMRAAFFLSHEGYAHYMYGRYDQALSCLDAADSISTAQGLVQIAVNSAIWRALCLRRAGRLEDAAQATRRIRCIMQREETPFAPLDFVEACIAHDRGDHVEAVRGISAARQISRAGGAHVGLMLVRLVSANVAIGSGSLDLAEEMLTEADKEIRGPVSAHYLGAISLNRAWLAHRRGDHAARDVGLAEALRLAQDARAIERYRWYPNALSALLPIAMERGIEPVTARHLARLYRILPDREDLEDWPWSVRVRTLGEFEVLVDDRPLSFGRKAPRKAMALLKCLIALGPAEVSENRLIDALWPGEDADDALGALGATLLRLRRILGGNEYILKRGNALRLAPGLFWIDAWQLDASDGMPANLAVVTRLYRGAFLQGDDDAPWALPMRDRVQSRFVHAIGQLASVSEQAGDYAQAITHYQRGIAADHLMEAFYQGLMRCHGVCGRTAEAAGVFRRLQRSLALSLNTLPSEQSIQIFRQATTHHRAVGQSANP